MIVFNGEGGEYTATLQSLGRNKATVQVEAFRDVDVESPLHIHLGQALSRGSKMDLTIQKAVELGVSAITPVIQDARP